MQLPPPRRLAILGLAATSLGLIAAPLATGQEAPQPSQVPGTGQAIAELIQLDPAIANLALTMRIGTSLAGHQNQGANAEGRAVDLGFIGDLLTGEACDGGDPTLPPGFLPDDVIVSSSDPAAANGASTGIDGVIDVLARADQTPSANTTANLLPLGLPGLVEIEGGRSDASSTAVDHVARAVSEIGRVRIADGLVTLEGLRWEAERRLLPEPTTTSSFTVGGLTIAGIPVPLPTGDVLPALQQVLDPVLDPLGIELSFPVARPLDDGVELTPLTVGVVPGELRDGILGPILGAIAPVRSQLAEFLIAQDCGNATYVTVLDVVVGAISGAGFTVVDLGGVTARSSELEFTSFLGGGGTGGAGAPSLGAPSTGSSRPAPARSGSVSLPPVDPPGGIAADLTGPGDVDEVAALPAPASGERGGPLLAIGVAGLLAAAAAAVADRRRMRRAQRTLLLDP